MMDATDDMIAFALIWVHFGGGPDEDIMVRFGLRAEEYYRRLQHTIQSHHHGLDTVTTSKLLKMCQEHLARAARRGLATAEQATAVQQDQSARLRRAPCR